MAMIVDPARVHAFETAEALNRWLARHHATEPELWVRVFKVDSGTPSLRWEDCVLEALAWGWIDGLRKGLDATSYLQRLTPRRPRSVWSQKNRANVEQLIAEGRLQPPGLAQVEAAKADGRWERAYAGRGDMAPPAEFLVALEANPAALAFYQTLDKQNHFAIYYRLHTAKRADTRARRIAQFVATLAKGERIV
jgi:uncharacterized protein YdeI (YjbR/CyaY-like superfamily)